MIPLKDGKVCWPKGFGSKKECLELLEREYAKRLEDIKLLQAALHKVSDLADTYSESAHFHSIIAEIVQAADGLDKNIYVSFKLDDARQKVVVVKEPPNG